jgi:putative hydrolase of the HAD superfamily
MPETVASGRAVLFDLDDTLYPERRFILSGFAAVADAVERRTGRPRRDVFRALVQALRDGQRFTALQAMCRGCGVPEALVPALTEVIRRHRPRLRLPDSSRRALAQLRGAWGIGIVTNGRPAVQAAKVEALGLAPLVDVVVFADECAPGGKPAVPPFAAALRRLGAEPARSVFVGDRLDTDVAGARAAGLWTLLFARRSGPAPGLPMPDRIVASLAEVPAAAADLVSSGGPGDH